ncbi:MAG: hypothetical protein E7654_03195 [Ruminococcaceae bacterium]|nr:hypothetical protein [Oscillospiraceae bacterium]
MRWNHIKTVTICLLLLVNAWLIFLLAERHIERTYPDPDVLQNTVEILARDGIFLTADQLNQAHPAADIYAAVLQEDYYEAAAALFSASPIDNVFPTPRGVRILTKAGDSLSFGSDYSVSYLRSGENRGDMANLTEQISTRGEKLSPSSMKLRKIRQSLKDLLEAYVGSGGTVAVGTRLTFDEIYGMGDHYLVRCSQTVDGRPLLNHRVSVVCSSDGELLYLDGTWSFLSLVRNYSAPLYDRINILFIEKDTVAEIRAEGGAADTLTLESLTLCYVPASAAEGDDGERAVYFSPAWRIAYTDGTVRVYHGITGQLIVK